MYAWEKDETHGKYDYNNLDSWKGRQLMFLASFIREKFPNFNDHKPVKILDIGCNAAMNLKMFSLLCPNEENEYHGYDINDTALDMARKNIPNGKFTKTNFHTDETFYSIQDDYFDFCFATWVFTHIPLEGSGRERTIKEALRISKNGIILDPYRKRYFEDVNEIKFPVKLPPKKKEQDWTHLVAIDDYKQYADFIQEHDQVFDGNTSIFFWRK
jgi:SAM-dependent methyltransferase